MYNILYMDVSLLESDLLYEKGMAIISEERRQKIFGLKNPITVRLSLGAGVLLSIALQECGYQDKINEIRYTEKGKPYLEGNDFFFNLSHSGHYAVCVYGDAPVGIDLQETKGSIPKHTKKILTDDEIHYLESLHEEEKAAAFYRIWARKESLIKWDGRGLKVPLDSFSTVLKNHQLTDYIIFENHKVYFRESDMWMPAYTACICSKRPIIIKDFIEIDIKFLTNY